MSCQKAIATSIGASVTARAAARNGGHTSVEGDALVRVTFDGGRDRRDSRQVDDQSSVTTVPRSIRVVFADDSYLVREAITHVLAQDPRIDLVAICEDGASLHAAIEAEEPDVVLTDIRMPPSGDAEGIAVANRLRVTHPEMGVVVVSQYADPRYGLALLEGGSDRRAYLLKERLHDKGQLVAALDAVAAGGSVIDPKVVDALIAARIRSEDSPLAELTHRELEILSEIAQGKSNQAIADKLVLTKRAVEKHINAIFLKLGLTTAEDLSRRVKAALIYLAQRHPGEPPDA
jgi:DNA-binding NarL/FixJ family response regulator